MFLLQLKNELWKLFGKKRTYIGTSMFLLVQVIIVLFLKYNRRASERITWGIAHSGFPIEHYLTNLTIVAITLMPIGYMLLPLYTALVGGDLVAKEAEDGTLRMILSRPVSRLRLLLLKWLAGALFSVALVVALGVFGVLFTRIFYPSGAMFVISDRDRMFGAFEGWTAWGRLATVHLMMSVEACSIMTLAFMFSCFNLKPATATILAISFFFINVILDSLPYLQDYKDWFLVEHLYLWTSFFRQPIPWWRVGESLSVLAGYNLTFLIIGCAVFQTRDIKS
jgi:ABC-2 type transport system permease protein